MTDNNTETLEKASNAGYNNAIREHTDGREFRPWLLLAATLTISAVLAAICYGLQIYFIGPG